MSQSIVEHALQDVDMGVQPLEDYEPIIGRNAADECTGSTVRAHYRSERRQEVMRGNCK